MASRQHNDMDLRYISESDVPEGQSEGPSDNSTRRDNPVSRNHDGKRNLRSGRGNLRGPAGNRSIGNEGSRNAMRRSVTRSIPVGGLARRDENIPLVQNQPSNFQITLIPYTFVKKWNMCCTLYVLSLCITILLAVTTTSLLIYWANAASIHPLASSNVMRVSYSGMYLIEEDSYKYFDRISFTPTLKTSTSVSRYECSQSLNLPKITENLPPLTLHREGGLFHWLANTTISLNATNDESCSFLVPYNSSKKYEEIENICHNEISPDNCNPTVESKQFHCNTTMKNDSMEEWMCTIKEDNNYFLCNGAQHIIPVLIGINRVIYNLTSNRILGESIKDGWMNYSFNIFKELKKPTCIFVVTNASATSEHITGEHWVNIKVHHRTDVIIYFVILIVSLIITVVSLLSAFLATKYRKDHPKAEVNFRCLFKCFGMPPQAIRIEEDPV